MSGHSLDYAAHEVLRQFPFTAGSDAIVALGNRGGFSGASLWRVEEGSGRVRCLRAWPHDFSADRLVWIHRLMHLGRDTGLEFIPEVFPSVQQTTVVPHAGRLWDLTTWMPGQADFTERPTSAKLDAACTALARLHHAWSNETPRSGRCPAIVRRMEQFRAWMNLVNSGWKPSWTSAGLDPVRPAAERAWSLTHTWAHWLPRMLTGWSDRSFNLQPCLCDLWHDHVLFQGDMVTGLIDYGGVKIDHPAVDLARLLGSTIGDEAALRASALDAYSRIRCLRWDERKLVDVLDQTGTVLALVTWLKWLYHDRRTFEDRSLVARHLARLVERVEKWKMGK